MPDVQWSSCGQNKSTKISLLFFSAGFAKDNVKSMLCVPIVQVIFLMCPNNIVDLMLPHQSTQICIKLDLHCMTGPQLGRYVSWRNHGKGRMPNLFRQGQSLDVLLTHNIFISWAAAVAYTTPVNIVPRCCCCPILWKLARHMDTILEPHVYWRCRLSHCPSYRTALSNDISPDSF